MGVLSLALLRGIFLFDAIERALHDPETRRFAIA